MIVQLDLEYNKEIIKKIEKKTSTFLGIAIISAIVITIAIFQYKPHKDDVYIDEASYPIQATEWMKENLNFEEVKLYNEYNYGSYLIYQNVPVFIDSRCDLYLPEFNENVYVFRDFLNMNNMNITNMEEKIDEYGFTHFIVSNGVRMKMYLDLKQDEYKKIYPTEEIEDNNFSIYERIK